ncbi:hypothetical protein QJS10_CPB17g01785 [Acorus calamus]|uniref:Uncharacterized protein n=1 Tax=Acorus calamus TaxID=4465 RepID=A0AAV9CUT6_ACOCL|nr:hypothetical protein QJS10_CPB17g01785 [Acorus calamus]
MVLHKVPPLLKSQSNLPFFVPEVVSIGPYHHCRSHDGNQLAAMVPYKIEVSAQYGNEARMRVHGLAEKVSLMYEGDQYAGMDRNAFLDMLFYDACFIIHFISTVGRNPTNSVSHTSSQSKEAPPPSVDMHLQGYVIRDLLLLENQLPYEVLKAVMPKGFENELKKFISERREPEHLLDMLHEKLVGHGGGGDKRSETGKDRWDSLKFRSVKELSEKGIKFLRSTTCRLTDVQYKA